ncbi:MAG: presqualene diphosphate synthase HpnD [Thiohalomonadaceae bacterium]|jgi:phytoene synthase
MTPDQYCQHKTAHSGSSFYYSFLFLPAAQRRAITALYAFCREVDDVVDECQDTKTAQTKLDWWEHEISRLYAGKPQHPVTHALQAVIANYRLPEEQFQEIIDGMRMDLSQQRYATFKDLSLYCYRVASVVGQMAAVIFGYENHRTMKYAHDLGMAFQLTNILRDVGEDAARGRIYLPQDEMERFGVSENDILTSCSSDKTCALFRFQATRARRYYNQAMFHLPTIDRYPQRSGLIMAAIYLSTLDAIEQNNYPVMHRRVSLPAWRKLWLAWRTARGETRRKQQQK